MFQYILRLIFFEFQQNHLNRFSQLQTLRSYYEL